MNRANLERARQAHHRAFPERSASEVRYFFSPGRVNLIGEHLDYNGGLVLPAAINLGIYAAVQPDPSRTWRVISREQPNNPLTLELDNLPPPGTISGWGAQVTGMLTLLGREGVVLKGPCVSLCADLPLGSGLSSSAALEILIGRIALALSSGSMGGSMGGSLGPTRLARLAQETEHRFLGLHCGIMDPYVIAHGVAGSALRIDCAREEHAAVPATFPGYQWTIVDSGLPRTLAESAYNERRATCEALARDLGLANLAEITIEQLNTIKDSINLKRATHVFTELQRVLAFEVTQQDADPLAAGRLLYASHASLRDDYEVSSPEMDMLVDLLCGHPACAGARVTGAGFGGCAVALIAESEVSDTAIAVGRQYEEKMGRKARFYPVGLVAGASEIA